MRHHEICRDQFGGKENIQVREDDKLFFWGRSFLRNKLLVTKGIDTRSKDATNVAPGLTTRSKKLQGARSFLGNRFTGNQGLFVSLLGLSPSISGVVGPRVVREAMVRHLQQQRFFRRLPGTRVHQYDLDGDFEEAREVL